MTESAYLYTQFESFLQMSFNRKIAMMLWNLDVSIV